MIGLKSGFTDAAQICLVDGRAAQGRRPQRPRRRLPPSASPTSLAGAGTDRPAAARCRHLRSRGRGTVLRAGQAVADGRRPAGPTSGSNAVAHGPDHGRRLAGTVVKTVVKARHPLKPGAGAGWKPGTTMATVEVSTPAGLQAVAPAKLDGFLPSAPAGWSPPASDHLHHRCRQQLRHRRARPSPGLFGQPRSGLRRPRPRPRPLRGGRDRPRRSSFSLSSEGEGAERRLRRASTSPPRWPRRSAATTASPSRIRSEIPLRRGLGSSAALAVAVAAAAGAADPFKVAGEFEGHLENAAASVRGGLVSAALLDTGPVAAAASRSTRGSRSSCSSPTGSSPTTEAQERSRRRGVADRRRVQPLAHGPAPRRPRRPALAAARTAGDDRLHQSQRARLFPEAPELLARLTKAGALMSCWSGAGPEPARHLRRCRARRRSVRDAGEGGARGLGGPGPGDRALPGPRGASS